ncbi:MAG TPA: ribonuclease III [Steroidobacteraceae bacterium]|nr:ribonuclease III [Steroidobacteraceae bacterium]
MHGDWPHEWLREKLGYQPRDAELFAAALTHRSAARLNYERLEFLGDAVLNLLVAEHLYRAFPQADEGDLSRLRARVVSSEPLAEIAGALGLGEVLQLGSGELKTGGFRRQSILADAFEAVCGAVYLDGGLEAARGLVARLIAPRIALLPAPETLKDAKTRLQEYVQSRGLPLPRYEVERTEGEAHEQTFWVACEASGLGLRASGSGRSRRRAEQEAAERILRAIDSGGEAHPHET